MSALQRRLSALEQAAWDRRKREIVRHVFADVARDRQWTPDDFARIEPALEAMCRRGATLREVMAFIADDLGVDVDELLADVERDRLAGGDRLR